MSTRIINVPKALAYINIGEPNARLLAEHRTGVKIHALRRWDNCKDFGFISAGQGISWKTQIKKLKRGDVVCAYVTGKGFVGIGECLNEAVMIKDFKTRKDERLCNKRLIQPTNILSLNSNSETLSEFAVQVGWYKGLTRKVEEAYSVNGYNLGITEHVYTNLKINLMKVEFIEDAFNVSFQWPGRNSAVQV